MLLKIAYYVYNTRHSFNLKFHWLYPISTEEMAISYKCRICETSNLYFALRRI